MLEPEPSADTVNAGLELVVLPALWYSGKSAVDWCDTKAERLP